MLNSIKNDSVFIIFDIIISIIGYTVFFLIIIAIINQTIRAIIHIFKEKKTEEKIDNLMSKEVPLFISRWYFHTYNKKLNIIENIVIHLFPVWYMNHHWRMVSTLFSGGYCYYFAHIMKIAFNRGEVCWLAPCSHFVWKDENGIAWDILGKEREETYSFLIPEEYIPEDIIFNYKQTNYKDHDIKSIELDRYLDIIDKYAEDNELEYNRKYVKEELDYYINGKGTKVKNNIKEKTEITRKGTNDGLGLNCIC